ncbi:MAG: tetratricopeptide repeat protein [Bacteroidota bacterium]
MNEPNIDPRIPVYLAKEMSPQEQAAFEAELEQHDMLSKQLSLYLQTEAAIVLTAEEERMAAFRDRYNRQKKSTPVRPLRVAAVALTIAAAIALLFLVLRPDSQPKSMDALFGKYANESLRFPELRGQNTDSLWRTTLAYLRQGEYAAAEPLLTDILADSNFQARSDAHLYLGHVYFKQKVFQQAISQYNQVEGASVQTAQWYRALSYVGMEDKDNSLKQLRMIQKDSFYAEKAAELIEMLEKLE